MIYCKFLPWSKNCRWNRVKMVKIVPKMAEIIMRTSHMIDNKIFNIFIFFYFFLWILLRPCFFRVFSLNSDKIQGVLEQRKEKVEKQKMLKILLFIICEAPKIISSSLGLFHQQFLLQSKNSQQIISGTPQFMIGLVNNARNKCQKL